MPVVLRWQDVALRLGLTVVAGALIGLNRGEQGRAAGLRTTLLVCLAASVAMIQANLLMNTTGKASDSFITLDLMRLPLGILSGMGFIGAGAIVRRDDLAIGVTTAATLWFVTVVGLALGGGQIGLGLAALALGIIVLWGLKLVERQLRQQLRGSFVIGLNAEGPSEAETRGLIQKSGCKVTAWGVEYLGIDEQRVFRGEVMLLGRRVDTDPPAFLDELAHRRGVLNLSWEPRWRP